jgi:hypothetical protein
MDAPVSTTTIKYPPAPIVNFNDITGQSQNMMNQRLACYSTLLKKQPAGHQNG